MHVSLYFVSCLWFPLNRNRPFEPKVRQVSLAIFKIETQAIIFYGKPFRLFYFQFICLQMLAYKRPEALISFIQTERGIWLETSVEVTPVRGNNQLIKLTKSAGINRAAHKEIQPGNRDAGCREIQNTLNKMQQSRRQSDFKTQTEDDIRILLGSPVMTDLGPQGLFPFYFH